MECGRVCKKGGFLIFTVNLPETMAEFYDVLKKILLSKSIENYKDYIKIANFEIGEVDKSEFKMKFLNGTGMFNYHFIRFWFLKPWIELFEGVDYLEIFKKLEEELNGLAKENGFLSLTIPFACFK